jgi:hypothetical protein
LKQRVSLGAFLSSGLCILNFSGKTPTGRVLHPVKELIQLEKLLAILVFIGVPKFISCSQGKRANFLTAIRL